MPICEMALFKAAYALVLKLAPVSRGSTANFMVFIIVSTHPGSCRLAAFRPVFGPAFAFRPLNEEYCIPDTVYTTSAFVQSRRNFFFRQTETTQQSCCSAAKRTHECAPRASPAGWASGPKTPTYPITTPSYDIKNPMSSGSYASSARILDAA